MNIEHKMVREYELVQQQKDDLRDVLIKVVEFLERDDIDEAIWLYCETEIDILTGTILSIARKLIRETEE